MAEIISKVSEKIKTAANITVKKTKSAANLAKYTVQVKSLNSELDKCYEKLGKALFRQIKLDEENDEIIAARVVEAQELQTEIDALKELIKKEKAEIARKKDAPIEAEFEEVEEDAPTDAPAEEEAPKE